MPQFGLKMLILITMIGMYSCQKIDPVLEPADAGRHLQASLRNGDTLSVMTQLLSDAASYSGTVIDGEDLMSVLNPEWDKRFNLNDSVMLVPCTSLQRFIPFSWAYLYYTMDSTMRIYYYEFVPDKDFAFSFETTEEFVQDFTGWGAVYVIGEGIVDASHYQQGVIDTIYVNETISAAQVRGGDNNWWNTRWDEWSPMFTDGVGEVGEDGPYQYPVICPTCKRNGRGSCPKKHCPHCDPKAINLDPSEIDLNELGNGIRPPIFSFNPGNNSGGIYNSGGSSSGANGIFSNIPSDFIDNWKQLDRECRNNIEMIQKKVGELTPEAWECLGQSCGVQEGANGAESGGTSNSMTDDVLDVLLHELDGATLVDPCNPNKPHQALMSELIVSLCGGEYMGRGDVFNSLNSSDIIIGDPSLNDCQNAKCMLRLLNDPSIKLYCNTVGNFMGNVNNSLKIEINYSSSVSSTGYDPNTNLITITLAGLGGACDGNPLEMASEILHEAVHAELFREVVEGHQNPFDPVSYEEMWNMALKLRWPDWEAPYVTAQHEVMANMYVQEIAQALQSVDNNRYSIDYYLYLAWSGLSVHGSYLGFVDYYISEYYDEYEFLMTQPFDRCD